MFYLIGCQKNDYVEKLPCKFTSIIKNGIQDFKNELATPRKSSFEEPLFFALQDSLNSGLFRN